MSDTPVDPNRSRIMSAIRCKDTKPEMAVRRMVHSMGYRYGLHARDLPGRPDLAFRSRKKAIFVHGCFWHMHEGCRKASIPATRTDWWKEKLERNVMRDRRSVACLSELGWESLTIWECETVDTVLLEERLRRFLGASGSYPSQSSIAVDSPSANVGFVSPHEADKKRTAQARDRQERGTSMTIHQTATMEAANSVPADTDTAHSHSEAGSGKASRAKASNVAATKASNPVKSTAGTAGKTRKGSTKAKPRGSKQKASTSKPSPAGPTVRRSSQGKNKPALRSGAEEHSLPKRYSATTDAQAGKVTITHGPSSVTIRMQSFASVSNVLAMLEEGMLSPAAQIEINDPFSGRRATVTAESLPDVAVALSSLAWEGSDMAGRTTPETLPVKPQAESAPVSAGKEGRKSSSTKSAGKLAQAKQASPRDSAPTRKAAKASAGSAASKSAKGAPSPSAMPDWYAGLKDEYVSEAANYRLIRAEVAIDPSSTQKSPRVTGRWGESEGKHAWGYEILSGDRHVAWVIAVDHRTFILTGALNYTPSTHRMIDGLMARVTSTVMPQFAKAA